VALGFFVVMVVVGWQVSRRTKPEKIEEHPKDKVKH
jgi:hypothetical protein